MKKELKTLSEKIKELKKILEKGIYPRHMIEESEDKGFQNAIKFIETKTELKLLLKFEEFIKRLKEEFKCWGEENSFVINKTIDKLAGEKLDENPR